MKHHASIAALILSATACHGDGGGMTNPPVPLNPPVPPVGRTVTTVSLCQPSGVPSAPLACASGTTCVVDASSCKAFDATAPLDGDVVILGQAIAALFAGTQPGGDASTPTVLHFPRGTYNVNQGFSIAGDHITVEGENRANKVPAYGDVPYDATVFKVVSQAFDTQRANAMFSAKPTSMSPAVVGIVIRSLSIDLNAPASYFTQPLPGYAYPSTFGVVAIGIDLTNPIGCTVEGVHVSGYYAQGIVLGVSADSVPTFSLDTGMYGDTGGLPSDCADNKLSDGSSTHKPSAEAYLSPSSGCRLRFTGNVVQNNLVEAYFYATFGCPQSDPTCTSPATDAVLNGQMQYLHEARPTAIAVQSNAGVLLATSTTMFARNAGYPSFTKSATLGSNTIQDNVLIGGDYGVSLVDTVDNQVLRNYVYGSAHRGISGQQGADFNTIRGNYIAGAGGSAVHIANSSDGNVVDANVASATGFMIARPTPGAAAELDTIALATATDGSFKDMPVFLGGEGAAVKAYVNCHQNRFTNNTIKNYRISGIRIGHHAVDNEVTGNTITLDPGLGGQLVELDTGKLVHRYPLPTAMRLGPTFIEQSSSLSSQTGLCGSWPTAPGPVTFLPMTTPAMLGGIDFFDSTSEPGPNDYTVTVTAGTTSYTLKAPAYNCTCTPTCSYWQQTSQSRARLGNTRVSGNTITNALRGITVSDESTQQVPGNQDVASILNLDQIKNDNDVSYLAGHDAPTLMTSYGFLVDGAYQYVQQGQQAQPTWQKVPGLQPSLAQNRYSAQATRISCDATGGQVSFMGACP